MKASSGTALALLLLVSACRIEPTPEEYIDHGSIREDARLSGAQEVRDRLLAMGQALSRGDPADALVALSPARDAYVVGPQAGLEVRGPEEIASVLASLASRPVLVALREVEVGAEPAGGAVWFRAILDAGGEVEAPGIRITGVYVRNDGAWELAQAHLSMPVTPTPSPGESAADSAGAG